MADWETVRVLGLALPGVEESTPYPYVLVRLDRIGDDELRELLAESWLGRAPKRLAAQLRSAESGG